MRLPWVVYTWHHHEVVGIMLPVRTDIHKAVSHIGGVFFYTIAKGGIKYKK
jgi:hypothetical protein